MSKGTPTRTGTALSSRRGTGTRRPTWPGCLGLLSMWLGLMAIVTASGQSLPRLLGDLDADGEPTVLDLVRLVNHLNLGTNAENPTLLSAGLAPFADLNEDGVISESDENLLADAILGFRPLPNPIAAPIVSTPVTTTNGTNIVLRGRTRPHRRISVEGGAGSSFAMADAEGDFTLDVPLQPNRLNRLFITATSTDFGASPPTPLDILQDSQPPSLYIDFPADGAELTSSNVVVAGRVGDMLSGFMGLDVQVAVDPARPTHAPANVNVGIGNNGTFELNVPLALGTNRIHVLAADLHGNSARRQITVRRSAPAGPRLVSTAGDGQITNVQRRLAGPIVARLTQADGVTPIADQLLTFEVTRSNGRLLPLGTNGLVPPAPSVTTNGALLVQVPTDAEGYARAWWTLGGDAGCGNNRVTVTAKDFPGATFFCASACPAPASQINIGTGNNQKAETGGLTPEPLRAWVSDSCNGISNVPVTFRIVQGGGSLMEVGRGVPTAPDIEESVTPLSSPDGAVETPRPTDELTIPTSITGHAAVHLQLGPNAGANIIEATFPGNPGLPATFTVYGVARDPARPTTFCGLVLDNANQPIGGALCELSFTGSTNRFAATTDAQGQFQFPSPLAPLTSPLPSGPAHLHVDGFPATTLGSNTIPAGSFPALAYSIVVVPNAENSLPMPVLLPPLNPNNARLYHGTNDLELTCEGMAGLKMRIKAGSMRKPDGSLVTPSNPALVALNQVHHDDVPMPMPDGAAPPFAWTLQPGGATFDPPIEITYPNMSALPPGGIAYFLSFNHDTERFEIVASGHVLDDGSAIVTDPGVGLSIAGWGCNCPPYAVTGQAQNCCQIDLLALTKAALGLVRDIALAVVDVKRWLQCSSAAVSAVDSCVNAWNAVKADGRVTPEEFAAVLDCARSTKATVTACIELAPDPSGVAKRVVQVTGVLAAAITAAQQLNCLSDALRSALAALALVNNAVNNLSQLVAELNVKKVALQASCTTLQLIIDGAQLGGTAGSPANGAFAPAVARGVEQLDALFQQLEGDQSTLTAQITAISTTSDMTETNALALSQNLTEIVNDLEIPEIAGFTVAINGQSGPAASNGGFQVVNISAPDQFGPLGPGSAPDFVADDFSRLVGSGSVNGQTRYVFSEYFQVRQGQLVTITNLTITDFPPLAPESLRAVPERPTLTATGQTTQVRVTAQFNDGSTADVSPRTRWTTYRTSNPNVATVGPDGLVTAIGRGMAFITAVNEGATTVTSVDVSPGDPLTTLRGLVVTTNGTPVAGAFVQVLGAAGAAVTGPDGRFRIEGVATEFAVQGVVATSTNAGFLFGQKRDLHVVPGGTTDAGVVELRSICDACSDQDGDGLADALELVLGTDPTRDDTDSDQLSDADEVLRHGTRPNDPDTDADGLDDRRELFQTNTSPFRSDTDADGWEDGVEVGDGSDPASAASRPKLFFAASPPVDFVLPSLEETITPQAGPLLAQPAVELILPAPEEQLSPGLGTVVGRPPVEVSLPAMEEVLAPAAGLTLALPPVEIILPATEEAALPGVGTVLAMPPVEVIRPAFEELPEGVPGMLPATPPVEIILPTAEETATPSGGTTLARPPVSIQFQTNALQQASAPATR